jgi:sulfur relay (sulfurtransferase) complex TusBCD TusD component (DsrE family)
MIAYPPERRKPTVPSVTLTVIVVLLLIIALTAQSQTSSSVSVAWNPSASSGIAGYRLYQGVASGSYTNVISVNQTNAIVSGLVTGVKYFFAVTAYTTIGLESPFSNEISYTPSTSTNGSLPAIALTSPATGASYQAPAAIGLNANVTANEHSINKVQFYNGSTLLAEDTAAPYSYTWNNVGAGSYSLKAQLVYDSTNTMVSTAVNLSVSAPTTGGSLTFASTSGTITSPFISGNGIVYQTVETAVTNGGRAVYTFTIPTAGNYTVSAMTIATNTAQNSFYVNIDAEPTDPTMIWDLALSATLTQTSVSWRGTGTDAADQFNPKVFALSQGTHQLIIIGRGGYAQLGTITIVPAGGTPLPPVTPPAIVLSSPNNKSTYTAPATVSLAATVTSNGHTIDKVQFYNGAILLAEDTAAPYSYTWNNVGAGNYSLRAQLVYDSTNTMVSTPVSVGVHLRHHYKSVASALTQTQVLSRGTGVAGSDQLNPKVFNLTQGTHQLIILGREANAQLGTITISPANGLPAPWQVLDIGNSGITGSASLSNGAYSVSGGGSLSGSSDNFRFIYQPMTGDGDLRARVTSLQNGTTNASAGLMVRETLTPGSRYVFLGLLPDGTVRSQSRANTASGSSAANYGSLSPPNAWARLVRSNNYVLGYKSSDGASWTLVGSNSIVMATNIYFGLAVASGTNNALATATLTNVVAVP